MSSSCPQLTHLNLNGSFRLQDADIFILVRACTELKELCLENCRKLTDQTFGHLIQHAPKLTSLDVGGNFNMTVEGLSHLIETHVNHSKFTKVHISGHRITNDTLQLISSKCRKLHSLCIGYASIEDQALIALLNKRKSINRVHVHWNTALTDAVLYHMSTECPNLQDVSLAGVKTLSNEAIAQFILYKMNPPAQEGEENQEIPRKKLKKIDLKYTNLTKESKNYITTTFPDLILNV